VLPRGAVGLSLLFLLPLGFYWLRAGCRVVRIALWTAVLYVGLLFYTMQYARFYIAIYPLVVVIGVAAVFHVTPARWSHLVSLALLAVLVMQPLVHSLQFWNSPERFPFLYVLGLEDRESFLRRTLQGYAAAMYVNTVCGPNETILGVDTENLRYYLRPSLETLAVGTNDSLARRLKDPKSNAELGDEMKRAGLQYLFTSRAATKNPPSSLPYLDPDFLRSKMTLVFAEDQVLVYRLH